MEKHATPTTFLVLPNFHSCFYNSIETWYMCFFSEVKWSFGLTYLRQIENWTVSGMCKAGQIGMGWSQKTPPSFLGFLPFATMEVKGTVSENEGEKTLSTQHVSVIECIECIFRCSFTVE